MLRSGRRHCYEDERRVSCLATCCILFALVWRLEERAAETRPKTHEGTLLAADVEVVVLLVLCACAPDEWAPALFLAPGVAQDDGLEGVFGLCVLLGETLSAHGCRGDEGMRGKCGGERACVEALASL